MNTTHSLHVLVSGGGIAGNAVALQLLRAGIRVTVVERAPRPGGQAVDLRGPSREVAERMGLMPGIRRRQLDERGMVFHNDAGHEVLRIPAELFDGKGGVAEIEITRGDLNQVLLDAIAAVSGIGRAGNAGQATLDYRYGDQVQQLRQDNTGAEVTFASGDMGRFDLVIGADGVHSDLRRMVFGPEEQHATYLGGYMSYFTVPTPAKITPHWFAMQSLPGATAVGIRPDADPTTSKALVILRLPQDPTLRRDPSTQKELIRRRLSGGGWETPAILAAMDTAEDFCFDELTRITMPTWTKERVTLLGDAGYCGSPLTGQGTAMALVGAYLLAGEITTTPSDPTGALQRYEGLLRPFLTKAHDLPPGGLRTMTPKTRWGIRAGVAAQRLMMTRPLRRLVIKAMSKTDNYQLPDYRTDNRLAELVD